MIYIYIKVTQRQRSREGNQLLSVKAQHSTLSSCNSPEWLISLRERKTYRERPSKPNESACYSTQLTENMKKCSGLLQPASISSSRYMSTSHNLPRPHITPNSKELKKKKKNVALRKLILFEDHSDFFPYQILSN